MKTPSQAALLILIPAMSLVGCTGTAASRTATGAAVGSLSGDIGKGALIGAGVGAAGGSA